jgi:hypothetical protein
MSNHPGSTHRGKIGPNSPRPHLLIDAATKSVTPKKKGQNQSFLDGFRADQIKGKCGGKI